MGDTIGVIEARGARGARLSSDGVSRVDRRGYAIAGNLSPYRMNEVVLDPKGLSADIELASSRMQTVPRAGAVVSLKFETTSGRPILVRGRMEDGSPIPFGAQAVDGEGKEIGIVGQGGQLFVRLSADSDGQINVNLAQGMQCVIDAPVATTGDSIGSRRTQMVEAVCHAAASPVARN
jgi:outer membrane usher protein